MNDKALSTAFFFLIITFLVYLSATFDPDRSEVLTMDEPLPSNSIVRENKIEGSPPEDVEELPKVVASKITDSFVLRESVPDPLPAIVPAPLPPADQPPAEPAPSTVVVVVVPEEPVDTEPEPTTDPPVVTTTEEPPVTTTEPPVTTTEPPVTTTEPPVTTTDEPTTTTEPPTTTTEEPDPVCGVGLQLDPILLLCIPI